MTGERRRTEGSVVPIPRTGGDAMLSRKILVAAGSALVLLAGAAYLVGRPSREESAPPSFVQEAKVIAGGPRDWLEVRHLLPKGSNEEPGRRPGQLARDRYNVRPLPSPDPLRTHAQRVYIEKNFPILYDRMRGAASAFDRNLDDDAWNH